MSQPIMGFGTWKTNGHLIADVARLGYIGRRVLDPTYGLGTWWTVWQPERLEASDLHAYTRTFSTTPTVWKRDFTDLPPQWEDRFDTVAFDPPYKLNGTPSQPDVRYGVGEPSAWQDRHALIRWGIRECVRVVTPGGTLLLKCQDQVCSGKVRWQTREFADYAEAFGTELVDRFDMVSYRAQPSGRRQVHARRNHSTLLIFRKARS